jgi:hypothetical protein
MLQPVLSCWEWRYPQDVPQRRDSTMRLTLLTTLCTIVLTSGFPGAARAQDYPWCVGTEEGRTDCSFTTYEQCKATASGIGSCFRNRRTLWGDLPTPSPFSTPPPSSTRRARPR